MRHRRQGGRLQGLALRMTGARATGERALELVHPRLERDVARVRRVEAMQGCPLPHDVRGDAGPGDRQPVPPPRAGRSLLTALRDVRDEAVAEGPVGIPRDETILAPPAGPVGGVERVEVEDATVRVEGIARGGRRVSVHRQPSIRQPTEEMLPATAVAPVEPDLELRQRPAPVRHPELEGTLAGLPRRKAEVGLVPLPPLDRPVRTVAGRAGGYEERERRAAIRAAPVPKRLPDGTPEGSPPTRVVDAELSLRLHVARRGGIQRPPHEYAPEPSLAVVRDERLPLRGDGETLARGVPTDELGRARDARSGREGRGDGCEREARAKEPAAARRIRSGAVTASDPDVERFLLNLEARRSPRTVDAYRRDLAAFRTFRAGVVAEATVDELERWLAAMRASGLAPSTIARRVSAVRAYFRHLVLI